MSSAGPEIGLTREQLEALVDSNHSARRRGADVRIAYADPPYPGQAKRHYGDHPDYAGEVDHRALVSRLMTFDAWALSTNSRSLTAVLRLCPEDVRVLVWIKRSAPNFPKHGTYGWEPVILYGARPPETRALRDWLICEPEMFTFRPKPADHVIGAKPPGFTGWLFLWLGLRPDDDFHDLYPGSGAVMRHWLQTRAQLTIDDFATTAAAPKPLPPDSSPAPVTRRTTPRGGRMKTAAELFAEGDVIGAALREADACERDGYGCTAAILRALVALAAAPAEPPERTET